MSNENANNGYLVIFNFLQVVPQDDLQVDKQVFEQLPLH